MTSGASSEDVASWMLEEFRDRVVLYQHEVAYEVHQRFGPGFTYINASGNVAISKPVLDAFRRLSGDGVVWVRSERCWRRREAWDLPSRQQF